MVFVTSRCLRTKERYRFVKVKKSEGFYWKQSELRKSVCFQLVFGKKWQVMSEWSLWCTNGCNKVVFKCLLKMT